MDSSQLQKYRALLGDKFEGSDEELAKYVILWKLVISASLEHGLLEELTDSYESAS